MGGFPHFRTERLKMNLAEADGLVTRVKGDGRTYQMRFNTEARFEEWKFRSRQTSRRRKMSGLK